MNLPLQTTCPRRLVSLAPPPRQRRPEHPCQRARNRSKRSTPRCRSSSRRVRTQRAPCAKSSLEGRRTRRGSGSVGSLTVGSSHGSGSGGIGRPSRAGGDAVRAGVNASNETAFVLLSASPSDTQSYAHCAKDFVYHIVRWKCRAASAMLAPIREVGDVKKRWFER